LLDQACAHCPIFPTAASRRSLGRVSVPVWLIVLSDQLPIAGLVGLYPTNNLIGRRLLPRRLTALDLSPYAVLAPVSQGCPPPQDTFLRDTHPSAADGRNHPRDLHVLSMPPAFALSQDQTLRFICATKPKPGPVDAYSIRLRSPLSMQRSPFGHHHHRRALIQDQGSRIRPQRALASKRPMQLSKNNVFAPDPPTPKHQGKPKQRHPTLLQDKERMPEGMKSRDLNGLTYSPGALPPSRGRLWQAR
jgi:hypothetical protein